MRTLPLRSSVAVCRACTKVMLSVAVNAPVAGRNSFTEGEAKSRIEKTGFSNVSNLKKDDDGVWRGRAIKDGKTVDVSVDFQGNVIQAGAQGTTAPSNTAQGGMRR